jgi:hypothetical protein
MAVVVAEKEGHVAMYRGQALLAALPPKPSAAPQDPNRAKGGQQMDALQEQLKGLNEQVEKNYFDNNARKQEGVEVERTMKK